MLYKAIQTRSVEDFRAALEAGADPNEVDLDYVEDFGPAYTPLMYLCASFITVNTVNDSNDRLFDEFFTLLIQYGADVNQISTGWTALHCAENPHVIMRLMEHGADPFLITASQNSAVVKHLHHSEMFFIPYLLERFEMSDIVQHLLSTGLPPVEITKHFLLVYRPFPDDTATDKYIQIFTELYSLDVVSHYDFQPEMICQLIFHDNKAFNEIVKFIMGTDRINPVSVDSLQQWCIDNCYFFKIAELLAQVEIFKSVFA